MRHPITKKQTPRFVWNGLNIKLVSLKLTKLKVQRYSQEIGIRDNKIAELKKENKKFLKLSANEVIEKVDYDEVVNEKRNVIKKLQSEILEKKDMLKRYTKSTEMVEKSKMI